MLKERQNLKVGNRYISRRFIGDKKVFENFTDKTPKLSGTEIYTDQADTGGVVHVEVGGKSYQEHKPSPDNPALIHSLNDFDVMSSVGRRNLLLGTHKPIPIESPNATIEYIGNFRGEKNVYKITNPYDYFIFNPSEKYSEELKNAKKDDIYTFSIKMMFENIKSNDNPTIYLGGGFGRLYELANGTVSSAKFNTFTRIATISDDSTNFRLHIKVNHIASVVYVSTKIKLEKGTVATPRASAPEDIPYDTLQNGLYKTNLLLDEPLRSVGDVKDRLFRDSDGLWKVERKIKEVILNGTEDWQDRGNSNTPGYKVFNIPVFVQNDSSTDYNLGLTQALSTHLVYKGTGALSNAQNAGANSFMLAWNGSSARNLYIVTKHQNVNEFKSALSNSEFIILYELRTPAIEILSQSLQNKLNNIASYAGSNYIYTIINDKNNVLSDKLKSTLHATFKSEGWYEAFKAGEVK